MKIRWWQLLVVVVLATVVGGAEARGRLGELGIESRSRRHE